MQTSHKCCNGYDTSQRKRPKFDSLSRQNRSSQNLARVAMSWTAPGVQNFVAIGSGVSAPQIRDFAVPFDMTRFFVVYIF